MELEGKVYSDNLFLGNVCGKTVRELKRKASTLCNRHNKVIDSLIVFKAYDQPINEVKFIRCNKIAPNNTIIRGSWN